MLFSKVDFSQAIGNKGQLLFLLFHDLHFHFLFEILKIFLRLSHMTTVFYDI